MIIEYYSSVTETNHDGWELTISVYGEKAFENIEVTYWIEIKTL